MITFNDDSFPPRPYPILPLEEIWEPDNGPQLIEELLTEEQERRRRTFELLPQMGISERLCRLLFRTSFTVICRR